MNGKSLNITGEKLARLKELLPETFSEGKVDWEKLRAALGGEAEFKDERYHLNWAGKTDAFRVLQLPATATLTPCREESMDFDGSGNLFIEGENLEALKILQKSYFGKVRMIYIDPPYNTGNDQFIYPDRFVESKDAYLKRIGDKDEQGRMTREGMFRKNSRENGHFHSNWLSMIYPRLFLARNLLREDGVIFISIDDNEVHNLRMVMNEIFGEENIVIQLVWKSRQIVDSRNKTNASTDHEYVLVYAKSSEEAKILGKQIDTEKYSNPDNDPRGPWMSNSILGLATASQRPNLHYAICDPDTGAEFPCPPDTGWRYSRETMGQKIADNRIVFPKSPTGRPREKKFFSELKSQFTGLSSVVPEDVGYTLNGTREVRDVMGGRYFDFPKPVSLLRFLARQGAKNKDDIILDFFAGSCTTAHAVLQLNDEDGGNRQFICIQMPEPCEEKTEAYKSGYKTIADIGKERIRRVIKSDDLKDGFKVFKLQKSNFKTWRGEHIRDEKELEKQLKIHITPLVESAETEHVLYELLLKSGLSLTSEIENRGNWFLARDLGATIALALESIDEAIIKTVIARNPQKFITLDHLFRDNDQLKTNTALLMEDAGIEFQTI